MPSGKRNKRKTRKAKASELAATDGLSPRQEQRREHQEREQLQQVHNHQLLMLINNLSLHEDTSDDTGTSGKKKKEQLVYQLSCKKCNKHMNFVGTTSDDLKSTMSKHFQQVVREAKPSKKRNSMVEDDGSTAHSEAWSAEFAKHFAKHCKGMTILKSTGIIAFCRANVKIEVLRRSDGAELYVVLERQ